ncbi:MAG: hypothetical protein GFH27_549289n94 [Chloroflexi bacterium AL-W]|nr:hypothetical protein [Chloroflexi bacterium AL-N1]NOK66826.1 hypothetical protein [Chloroflexi bacterium AL-N10]NOK74882.1 hypothetical protein [Chloroflexi bacterium AL-N5]NOK81429.1 hypothetical protein [Chloroflexi bacterium AL-W]NOK88898.1 hypothetical protein [Chloroflexi bacterium AL-N15]
MIITRCIASIIALIILAGCAFLPSPSADTISVADAQQILAQAETFAQAGDIQGLCALTDLPRRCERAIVRVGGIATAPTESPQIVDTYLLPDQGQYVGYRVLVLEGEDATGKPYRTEFGVFYNSERKLSPMYPVYWSGGSIAD